MKWFYYVAILGPSYNSKYIFYIRTKALLDLRLLFFVVCLLLFHCSMSQ